MASAGRPDDQGAAFDAQATNKRKRGRRGGRRRGKAQGLRRQIDAKSLARQEAWAEGGQPDLVEAQSLKLARSFAALRTVAEKTPTNDFKGPSTSLADGHEVRHSLPWKSDKADVVTYQTSFKDENGEVRR